MRCPWRPILSAISSSVYASFMPSSSGFVCLLVFGLSEISSTASSFRDGFCLSSGQCIYNVHILYFYVTFIFIFISIFGPESDC